ncbi:MAG: hypothetical protein JO345_29435 [Streptosporangiaceae bacterium]|nr:hypothetical protein [Streptosporangiaceae bacterium]
MTATAAPARRRPISQTARRAVVTTPAAIRVLMMSLVLLSLTWGAFGGWAANEHSSGASAVVAVDEPLSLDARQMYESLADADVTITTAFLASAQPPLRLLQRYQADIATASADLAKLRTGGGNESPYSALSSGLPRYTGYVADAESQYSLGYPLTGGSFMQVASEEAHLVLLPAAKAVFTQENAALTAASSQATGLPTMIVALVIALIAGVALYRAQRWLTRRTNRVFSAGLMLASALLAISAVWIAAAFGVARSDLDRGIGQGSQPAETLAQASISVQQIRGDAVLNVISRSGDASFQQDFVATSKLVGPGNNTLLTSADAASTGSRQAASLVAAAEREATAWYAANSGVYRLGVAANYGAERNMVIGTGSGSSAAGYAALENDITQAINDDQAVFRSAATAGANVLNPLEPVVIAASLLMAVACVWGFSRRLAEYR